MAEQSNVVPLRREPMSPREHARRIRMERGELPDHEYRSGEVRIITDRTPPFRLVMVMIAVCALGIAGAIWLAV